MVGFESGALLRSRRTIISVVARAKTIDTKVFIRMDQHTKFRSESIYAGEGDIVMG